MKRRHRWLRIVPLAAAAWLACSAVPAQAGLFDDDIARKQIADLERRLNAANTNSEQLAARLTAMEDTQRGAGQPILELASQLQALREEMRSLRGQIEILSNTVEGNAKRQRDMYVDLDSRLRRFESPSTPPSPGAAAPAAPVAPAGAAAPAASSTASGPAIPPPPPSALAGLPPTGAAARLAAAIAADDKSAYESAQDLRRNGNYQAAIAAFEQFIQQHPKSPLAHRAQYWIGDTYYNLRDYRSAIAAQQKLVATYPDSPSVPDAMLNMASAQSELGETRAARTTMSTLIARYPTSDAADKAKRRLSLLR